MATENTHDVPMAILCDISAGLLGTDWKFSPGSLYLTRGVYALLAEEGGIATQLITFLSRHLRGDWGDVCQEDWQANDLDLEEGGRLLSVYHTSAQVKLYCITEWDRSATTLLLPEEY